MNTPTDEICYIQFTPNNSDLVKLISVCEVTAVPSSTERKKQKDDKKQSIDTRKNTHADLRMGPLEDGVKCETCVGDYMTCGGHPGHISLPIPVTNKLFHTTILKILQSICLKCSRSRIHPDHASLKIPVSVTSSGRLDAVSTKSKTIAVCPHADCKFEIPIKIFCCKESDEFKYPSFDGTKILKAKDILDLFRNIPKETCEFIGVGHNSGFHTLSTNPKLMKNGHHIHSCSPDSYIIENIQVLPPQARPYVMRDGQKCDDDLTEAYNNIVKCCIKLRGGGKVRTTKRRKPSTESDVMELENKLRDLVWSIIINDKKKLKNQNGARPCKSITSRITKKEGQIQVNIAGKRVDYSARDVIIGGSIEIKCNEFGVPLCIANALTYPDKVHSHNFDYLQSLVSEGKVKKIIRDKRTINLSSYADKGIKMKLQIGDKIARVMMNGDVILVNRQPTLRKEGMKGFFVKIVAGNAFRLAESFTKSFNADFDGDEMNIHIPQDAESYIECATIMRAAMHIVSEQKNGPVDGIVQDGLVGSYILTMSWSGANPDIMVNKGVAMDCIVGAGISKGRYTDLLHRAAKYYPDYIKVTDDYCELLKDEIPGKLFYSILFPRNLNYKKKTDVHPHHPIVEIENGIILPTSGPVCSKIVGSKQGSIVHILWKEYSPDIAVDFLSECQQITNRWLPHYGFSFGLSDCMLKEGFDISEKIKETKDKVNRILRNVHEHPTPEQESDILSHLNSLMNEGLRIGNEGLVKGQRNALNIMRDSGAKGAVVNTTQITVAVGQQNTKGSRIESTLSGGSRTLPHFDKYDNGPEAKGMVWSSYVKGLSPSEAYHHAICGRRGLLDTSMNTSNSGYINKKLSKKVEDNIAKCGMVVDATGRIVQFLYGGDGMGGKYIYNIPGRNLPFFINCSRIADRLNSDYELGDEYDPSVPKRAMNNQEMELLFTFIRAGYFENKSPINNMATTNIHNILRSELSKAEIYEDLIPDFCFEIRDVCEKSKIQTGEAVGLISASSIGEPTTQMVLNSFHNTGSSKDANVGIPRFNEILNATLPKTQKKPSCRVALNNKYKHIKPEIIYRNHKNDFEYTTVSHYFVDYELFYVPGSTLSECGSPVSVMEYHAIPSEWWVRLKKHLGSISEIPPLVENDWMLKIKLNPAVLIDRKLSTHEIAVIISKESEGHFVCVESPTIIGEINIYCKFDEIKKKLFEKDHSSIITKSNASFYVCRDIVLGIIKNTKVTGINGVTKAYAYSDIKSGETYLDLKFGPATNIVAFSRYLDILNNPIVNPCESLCDDIHTIYAKYGIEALRRFLIDEIYRIICSDSVYINKRHIELLVDTMTYTGEITAVSRDGISADTGPITKIMFEDAIKWIKLSTQKFEKDDANSLSACVMLGKKAAIGTGSAKVVRDSCISQQPVPVKKGQIPVGL